MSGISGLLHLDDAPVAEQALTAMTAMLEQRGPERTCDWRGGPVGFGHTLLATTPELVLERQPFEHPESGCVITADVRLDNRKELHETLQLTRPLESVGDAELILLAYLRWGDRCPEHLLGDFAFAVWDPRQRAVFCARDHFGMRPFYYHHAPGQRFVFASDSRAILVLPRVPYRINEGRIADFLVPQLEWIDYTSTFFEDVHRLPPGHTLNVSPQGVRVAEYWRPAPVPGSENLSDDDYREGFLEVFTQAVESRLRGSPGATGSMLSGGMDSGSVVAVAGDILASRRAEPLRTISATRPEHEGCAESRAIRAAAALPSIVPAFVYLEDTGKQLERLLAGNEEPFDGEAMLLKAVYGAAHAHGLRVLLDGAGGDVVLGEGSYISRLLRGGRFIRAMQEVAGENRFWGEGSLAASSARYLSSAFVPEPVKSAMRGPRYRRRTATAIEASLVSLDFAERIGLEARFERMREMTLAGWVSDYALERCSVIRPSVTAGRERYARLAARHAVEACDPYLDRRVVDFCTRLPGHLRMRNGWPKMVLRDLMDERLPDEVRWLRGKPHLGWRFNTAVTREAANRGALSLEALRESLAGYVDPAKLREAWRAFKGGGDAERIHSAHVVSVWLRENSGRPVVPQ